MKKGPFFLVILLCVFKVNCQTQGDTTDRVAVARSIIGEKLEADVKRMGGAIGNRVFLRGFKYEKELELWIEVDSFFCLFRTYPICTLSGKTGPKRQQGDLQVPEGVYFIDRFQPKSKYHLSLRINYPKAADLYFANSKRPGGEIYIHGQCASAGCIPIKNSKIEEVYLLTWEAKESGQEQIPVHIFPCEMDKAGME